MSQQTAITLKDSATESIHLVARNAVEMQAARDDLKAWLNRKLTEIEKEIVELNAAIHTAETNGWHSSALSRQRDKSVRNESFYFKVLQAVEAGYTIVPNFPIDVFAIRVKRKDVTYQYASTELSYQNPANDIPDQRSDKPKAGEGRYESPVALLRGGFHKEPDDKGGEKIVKEAFTDDWGEIVFPLRAARPEVMSATAEAMARKVFDEIGICPRQPQPDPLIIGRILGPKNGWTQKSVSFLIAWHLDLRAL